MSKLEMFSCDICQVTLQAKDVIFHNYGKRHAKNLVKMKLELQSIKRTVLNDIHGADSVQDNKESTSAAERVESTISSETAPHCASPTFCTPTIVCLTTAPCPSTVTTPCPSTVTTPCPSTVTTHCPSSETTPCPSTVPIAPCIPTISYAPTPSKSATIFPNVATKLGHNNRQESITLLKNKRQCPEINKKQQKRKRKDDLPKPCLPEVAINTSATFDQQAISFILQIEQSENEWMKIDRVLKDVEYTFRKVIRDVKPILYGSSFTGLAFRTSDIDVYLYDRRRGEPDRDFVKRAGKVIYHVGFFKNIVRIVNARVPVIKATHITTEVDLDISATSGQAVANSRLLRFLLSYDWRIRTLMMLIGYFGKKYILIGVNKFSRYSINLLIVFYLQNLGLKILPPLKHIIFDSPGRPWPFSFRENPYLLINSNRQSLAELFMGFFEFYQNFSFSDSVISTYLGEKIDKDDLEKEEVLKKMKNYKNFTEQGGEKIVFRCICIQDPLELSHNTTKGITEKVLEHLKFICTNALKIKETANVKDWLLEMLKMEHLPPNNKDRQVLVSFEVKYNHTGGDCVNSVMQSLGKVFEALWIDIDWSYPSTEDKTKKQRLTPGFSFLINTNKVVARKGLKSCLNQWKSGKFSLADLQKALSEISSTKNQVVFNAECFVSLNQSNVLRITIKTIKTANGYFNIIPLLKNNLEALLTAVSKEQALQSRVN